MPDLKVSFRERAKKLLSKTAWGEDALPPLTLRQAQMLIDALGDMYAVGVLHGEMAMLKRCRQLYGERAPCQPDGDGSTAAESPAP